MLNDEPFLTLAEVAIAFVGFSALIFVFRQRQEQGPTPLQRFASRIIIEMGLFAVLFAFLPPIVALFDLPAETIWRLCEIGLATFFAVYFAAHPIRRREFVLGGHMEHVPRATFLFRQFLHFSTAAVLLADAIFQTGYAAGIYAAAIGWLLMQMGLIFASTITVVQQE